MSEQDGRGLSQIDHPDREYVHVVHAYPEDVQKQIVAEAVVRGMGELLKKRAREDPFKFAEDLATAKHRLNCDDENHRTAEGIA